MAPRVLNGNISGLELDVKDHVDMDLCKSIVDGADEDIKKSKASKPTLYRLLLVLVFSRKYNQDEKKGIFTPFLTLKINYLLISLAQTVGMKSLGSLATF
jgi:hypothetical protein